MHNAQCINSFDMKFKTITMLLLAGMLVACNNDEPTPSGGTAIQVKSEADRPILIGAENGKVYNMKDGSVYACDHFVREDYRIGRLTESSLAELVNSEKQLRFGRQKKEGLTAFCRACPWLSLCGGGCPKDRFGLSAEGQPGQYWLCPGLKAFFAHAQPVLERVMAMSAQGKTSPEIMAEL